MEHPARIAIGRADGFAGSWDWSRELPGLADDIRARGIGGLVEYNGRVTARTERAG